jgi:hypothetical protein
MVETNGQADHAAAYAGAIGLPYVIGVSLRR